MLRDTCDGCGTMVEYEDPYGTVALILCAECNHGIAIAGPQYTEFHEPLPPLSDSYERLSDFSSYDASK